MPSWDFLRWPLHWLQQLWWVLARRPRLFLSLLHQAYPPCIFNSLQSGSICLLLCKLVSNSCFLFIHAMVHFIVPCRTFWIPSHFCTENSPIIDLLFQKESNHVFVYIIEIFINSIAFISNINIKDSFMVLKIHAFKESFYF